MAQRQSWQLHKSAPECHKYMLDNSIATDVTFVVSNKLNVKVNKDDSNCVKRFKAHKHQLICRSPVFHAMLCGGLAEKGDIVVDDIHPDAFRQLLNYIYIDEVDMNLELAMPVMYAAKKYLIPGLTQWCIDYLAEQLSSTNACTLFEHSLLLQETEIFEMSYYYIVNHTKACLEDPSLVDVRQSTLSKLLDSDWFTATEIDVFSACEVWARHQVKQEGKKVTGKAMRDVLGDCVTKIRYPAMQAEEFGSMVAPKEILLPTDEIAIFRYLTGKMKVPPPHNFQSKERLLTAPFTIAYRGNCTTEISMGGTVKFDITCNQNINVKQIVIGELKPGRSTSWSIAVNLKFLDVCLDKTSYKVKSFETGNPSNLVLDESINFKRNQKYCLRLILEMDTKVLYVREYPSFQCANRRHLDLLDTRTGLKVSVSSNNHIFLLGFVCDFI